jgi:hypothetical protein
MITAAKGQKQPSLATGATEDSSNVSSDYLRWPNLAITAPLVPDSRGTGLRAGAGSRPL